MTFEEALTHLRAGKVIRRDGWNHQTVGIVIPVAAPNRRKPFVTLRMNWDDGSRSSKPWQPYAHDFSADDWSVAKSAQ